MGIRILFTLIFALTSFLTLTVLGHAQGPLDFVGFGLGLAGLILTWRLGRQWAGTERAPIKLAIVLTVLAVLPVRLAIEILAEVLTGPLQG